MLKNDRRRYSVESARCDITVTSKNDYAEPAGQRDPSSQLELQRLEQLARRQAEALARRIDFLASEPRAEKLLAQTLKAITEQLGGDAGTLCMYEASAASARCVDYRHSLGDTAGVGAGGGAVPALLASEPGFQESSDRPPPPKLALEANGPHGARFYSRR